MSTPADNVIELPGGLGQMTAAEVYWLGVKHGRAAEREACAQIAERMLRFADTTSGADKAISDAIRKGTEQ